MVLLTQHEARILKLLMAHRGEVVPKEALQYAAWGAVYPSSRRLGMCIHSLRKKLETIHPGEGNHHSILTMYGEGYSIS
ncbi:MAG TPA: helix-turn-helix domain-containing protein [Spirochaetia bacterium]|nr:helix-turn-helix domain-containing protein [Spirochaetia bacterium]